MCHQLVEQLGIINNRLLSSNTKVGDCLVRLIDQYEAVFTDECTAVGKTNVLTMFIVLSDDVKSVHAHVHKTIPHLQPTQ